MVQTYGRAPDGAAIGGDLQKSHKFAVGSGRMTASEAAYRLNCTVAELPPPTLCNGFYDVAEVLRLVREHNATKRGET